MFVHYASARWRRSNDDRFIAVEYTARYRSKASVIEHNTMTSPGEVCLPLMEHFYTIQGEGAYQGHAAYFIRLGGCDVGCVWCDVKESWDASAHPQVSVEEMVGRATASGSHIVVITGGEPAMY